jgi:hypothetical protein
VTHDEQSSLLLIGYPCPDESGSSPPPITLIDSYSTLVLGLVIEESEHFGATDLTG